MARLQVPDSDRPSILELTHLTSDQLQDLDRVVTAGRSDRLQTERGMEPIVKSPTRVLNALISMTAARLAHGLSTAELQSMLLESLGSEAGPSRLDLLLENSSILRFAKQLDLETAFERGLHTFRIITDIRPIFDEDLETGIGAALISHNIQVTYVRDNAFQEIYIAADLDDLRLIRKQVDRAIQKAELAESFVVKAGATVLPTKENV